MWQAVKSYFSKPSWHRLFEVCELLLLDLIKGVVAMVCIKLFSDVSSVLGMDEKVVAGPLRFGDLFRLGHAANIIVVMWYTLKHLVHALRS